MPPAERPHDLIRPSVNAITQSRSIRRRRRAGRSAADRMVSSASRGDSPCPGRSNESTRYPRSASNGATRDQLSEEPVSPCSRTATRGPWPRTSMCSFIPTSKQLRRFSLRSRRPATGSNHRTPPKTVKVHIRIHGCDCLVDGRLRTRVGVRSRHCPEVGDRGFEVGWLPADVR